MVSAVTTVDGLETRAVNANDLETGDYVLLAEDVDLGQVPLLVSADAGQQELWRVAGWIEEGGQSTTVRFDAPVDGDVLDVLVGPDDEVRLILPGQDHDTWGTDRQ